MSIHRCHSGMSELTHWYPPVPYADVIRSGCHKSLAHWALPDFHGVLLPPQTRTACNSVCLIYSILLSRALLGNAQALLPAVSILFVRCVRRLRSSKSIHIASLQIFLTGSGTGGRHKIVALLFPYKLRLSVQPVFPSIK